MKLPIHYIKTYIIGIFLLTKKLKCHTIGTRATLDALLTPGVADSGISRTGFASAFKGALFLQDSDGIMGVVLK